MRLRKSLDAFYYSTALFDLRLMNKKLQDKSMTYNSLLYLEIIYSMKGRATASRIAELLYVSKPAVTLKINELIKEGFVIKTTDEHDHRQSFLEVNEEMVPIYKVYRMQDDLAIKRIKEEFSEEDIDKLARMLDIITQLNYGDYK